MLVLHQLAATPGAVHEQAVYLSASALAGLARFVLLSLVIFARRKNVLESPLERPDTAASKGKHGGRPPVITADMLHTVLRRRTLGESVEQIQPDLITPTGKRREQSPSVAGFYRTLAEYAKREAYPEVVGQAHAAEASGVIKDGRSFREGRRR